MAEPSRLANRVRDRRLRSGWSQEALARHAGLSRAAVSAIETGQMVPSTVAALSLAAALGVRVEDLFWLPRSGAEGASWAWGPPTARCRYWRAEVGGRIRLYPVEATPLGVVAHDGVADGSAPEPAGGRGSGASEPSATLVVACCDPAVGLLAAELARVSGVRLIALPRSSRAALGLLGRGLVHVAGVHLERAGVPGGNAAPVRAALGPGYTLLRAARWEEGIALGSRLRVGSVGDAVRSSLRWVGREEGSGARQCLDELLGARRAPRRLASDHRGVAEAVRNGWADAGVCLRLVSEEAGLNFLVVRQETYDLCFPSRWEHDPRLRALLAVVRSPSYRRALGDLPGYESAETGQLHRGV
jgi:molybdate-binding protein/DNA-binding XRE family transcriptional regulator